MIIFRIKMQRWDISGIVRGVYVNILAHEYMHSVRRTYTGYFQVYELPAYHHRLQLAIQRGEAWFCPLSLVLRHELMKRWLGWTPAKHEINVHQYLL